MNCSLRTLTALVLGTVVAVVAAALSALGGAVAPSPWDVVLLIAATALIAGVLFGLLAAIEGAFNAYRACRDQAQGPSRCSTRNVNTLLVAIRVALGIALSTFGIAAAKIVLPWIGKILAGQEIVVGVAACGVATALLLALLAELQAYERCRNNEQRDSPGSSGSDLVVEGPTNDVLPGPKPQEWGETWEADGVPPARDPRARWYQGLTVEELWTELTASFNNNAALVTLKRAGLERGYFNGVVLISDEEIASARRRILEVRGVQPYDGPGHELGPPIMADGRAYPALALHVHDRDALARLVALDFVEAVEPLFVAQDRIGCSLPVYNPNPADGMWFGNRIPWTFRHLGVIEAWDLYKVGGVVANPGYPIRIGVVDTGVYQDEHQLTTVFHWGGLRSPALHRTVVSAMWDDCGHGTRIAGLATAPLDTQNLYPNKIVGVAWGSNLTTVKYNSGVVAYAGNRFALVDAIRAAVADGSRIVNLALGMTYWSSLVYDVIAEIFNTTETIFVCAAGTFVSSVQFPAAMPQVLAVCIVKSKDTGNPGAGYEKFGGVLPESAYGPEVDIAAINGDGDIPTTGGPNPDGGYQALTTIGGSSSGTAHVSGILALIWGKQPSASRWQVAWRLFRSGSLGLVSGEEGLIPGFSQNLGYGIPDVYVAAGGSRRASIGGPSTVLPGARYTLSVWTDGWLPLNYRWNTGEAGQAVTFTAPQSGTVIHSVTATNPIDGRTIAAGHSVNVARTHRRVLYSDPPIVRYPPYPFCGGTYDVKVNAGVKMPAGCAVLSCLGQKLDYVDGRYVNNGPPLRYLYLAWIHGFTVDRPAGVTPDSLEADARVWHSGTNAIRMRIYYLISEVDGVDANVPGTIHGWYPP